MRIVGAYARAISQRMTFRGAVWSVRARFIRTCDEIESLGYTDKGSFAPLAQLDRAFGYEPKGREFESLRAHHSPSPPDLSLSSSVFWVGSGGALMTLRSFRPRLAQRERI